MNRIEVKVKERRKRNNIKSIITQYNLGYSRPGSIVFASEAFEVAVSGALVVGIGLGFEQQWITSMSKIIKAQTKLKMSLVLQLILIIESTFMKCILFASL